MNMALMGLVRVIVEGLDDQVWIKLWHVRHRVSESFLGLFFFRIIDWIGTLAGFAKDIVERFNWDVSNLLLFFHINFAEVVGRK